MFYFRFSEESVSQLCSERFTHPHPRVQQKLEALLLKSENLSHDQIARIVGICPNTLRGYFEEFEEGGIERLKEIHFHSPQSDLIGHTETIISYFEKHPPATIKEAAAMIEQLTGIKRSLTQTRKFLKSIKMARRKTGSIPAKVDVEKQEAFLKNELQPRLEEARTGNRILYFVDAAHFVFAPFLGFLWCFTRLFVKAPSGRQRFNVLGAINAVTHELLTVTNNAYINAESVCELLRKIAKEHLTGTVTLVLDNARYQKCALVQSLADSLGIELLYLPSYSPNLNLIERVWKFTKKHCLNSKYYGDFQAFSLAISNFLGNAHLQHRDEMCSLLTHKFQDFSKVEMRLAA